MGHSRNPGYKPGEHWAVCMRCGFDKYASQLIKEWTGLWVCKECWDPRHPGDFVRGVPDNQTAPQPVNPPPAQELPVSETAICECAVASSAVCNKDIPCPAQSTFTN